MVSLGEEIGSRGGEEEVGFEPLTVAMAACDCRLQRMHGVASRRRERRRD